MVLVIDAEEFKENIEAIDDLLELAGIGKKYRDRIVDAYLTRMTGNKALLRLFYWLRTKPYNED